MRYFMEDKDFDGEGVCLLKDFKMMLDDDIKEMELLEMKRKYGGEMWCEENGEFVEKGDCGKFWCNQNQYNPCNGKSGRCRSLKNGFIETGKKFILTKSGLKEVKA